MEGLKIVYVGRLYTIWVAALRRVGSPCFKQLSKVPAFRSILLPTRTTGVVPPGWHGRSNEQDDKRTEAMEEATYLLSLFLFNRRFVLAGNDESEQKSLLAVFFMNSFCNPTFQCTLAYLRVLLTRKELCSCSSSPKYQVVSLIGTVIPTHTEQ